MGILFERLAVLGLDLERRVFDVELRREAAAERIEHITVLGAIIDDEVSGKDVEAARDGPGVKVVDVAYADTRLRGLFRSG